MIIPGFPLLLASSQLKLPIFCPPNPEPSPTLYPANLNSPPPAISASFANNHMRLEIEDERGDGYGKGKEYLRRLTPRYSFRAPPPPTSSRALLYTSPALGTPLWVLMMMGMLTSTRELSYCCFFTAFDVAVALIVVAWLKSVDNESGWKDSHMLRLGSRQPYLFVNPVPCELEASFSSLYRRTWLNAVAVPVVGFLSAIPSSLAATSSGTLATSICVGRLARRVLFLTTIQILFERWADYYRNRPLSLPVSLLSTVSFTMIRGAYQLVSLSASSMLWERVFYISWFLSEVGIFAGIVGRIGREFLKAQFICCEFKEVV